LETVEAGGEFGGIICSSGKGILEEGVAEVKGADGATKDAKSIYYFDGFKAA
jgi:hypothetical protein